MSIATGRLTELVQRSVGVIREGQAESGAYLAGPTFRPYRYSWFRDGSFIADAMSRVGKTESAEAFFDWCARIIVDRQDSIDAGEHLHARYTAEGHESEEAWPTFQLDGYGLWLWALADHCERSGKKSGRWGRAIALTQLYLDRHWHESCTDWWEEREGVHPATLACVAGGLDAWGYWQPRRSELMHRLQEELAAPRLDASVLVVATPVTRHNELPPELLSQIENRLVSPGGGVHRHEDDVYYGGGEWLLLTAMLGWVYAELGRTEEARAKLEWVAAHATADGDLPEQSKDHLLAPDAWEPWVDKWGLPASPLLWSHAMFLTLAHALGEVA